MRNNKTNILFVCMGNICRSPTADAVMQKIVNDAGLQAQFEIDSAGTHAYHIGSSPDIRAQETAQEHGVKMSHLRARKISVSDYDYYHYILAMDYDNLELIRYNAPENYSANIELFLSYAKERNLVDADVVPDPYYGGSEGFEAVFNLVQKGCESLLEHILHQRRT